MSKKPWKESGTPMPVNPQKYKWTHRKTYNSFAEADSLRNKLKGEGLLVKVKRCGPMGTNFKVITGSEIKTNKKLKGEKNATE